MAGNPYLHALSEALEHSARYVQKNGGEKAGNRGL